MQDFPSNSKTARSDQPREKIERVTTAEPVRRKRGLGRKFKDTFIGGDTRGAAEEAFVSVIVPSIRDMLYEAFTEGIRRLIFGESNRPRPGGPPWSSPGGSQIHYHPYNKPSTVAANRISTPLSRESRARHDFYDLVIPTREAANEVLERMYDLLSQGGYATVADLYVLTGVPVSHTDEKWGWIDLGNTKTLKLRQGGYCLDLPKPEPLN